MASSLPVDPNLLSCTLTLWLNGCCLCCCLLCCHLCCCCPHVCARNLSINLVADQVSFGAANANKFFNNKQPDEQGKKGVEQVPACCCLLPAWNKVDPSPTHKLCTLRTLKNKLALGPRPRRVKLLTGNAIKTMKILSRYCRPG